MQIGKDLLLGMLAGEERKTHLDNAVRTALSNLGGHDALVMVANTSTVLVSSVGTQFEHNNSMRLESGCLTKLFTAVAFTKICGQSAKVLNRPIGDFLDRALPSWASHIPVQYLLEHTHGIDEPDVGTIPRTNAGLINSSRVLEGCTGSLLFRPGEMYSYSNFGSWLLAAILEAVTKEKIADIFREVFPGGIFPHEGDQLCPATGTGMTTDFRAVLPKLCSLTAQNAGRKADIVLGAGLVRPLSGWNPVESGVCLGWKSMRNGWFGHQSALVAPPSHIRVLPTDGLGIFATSPNIAPWMIIQRILESDLIGGIFPSTSSIPVFAGDSEHLGQYERANSRVTISWENGNLCFDAAFAGTSDCRFGEYLHKHTATLKHMNAGIFQLTPSDPHTAPFLTFVRNERNRVSHIWNGRIVWRKTAGM
jgi:hypothetical protein